MSSDPKPVGARPSREESNPFDTDTGNSGQEYHRDREQELIDAEEDNPDRSNAARAGDDRDAAAPPEAGQRAWIDPQTGAVHGAGAGAGGGNPGEDYDSDAPGGSGYPRTGVEDVGSKDDRTGLTGKDSPPRHR